MTFGAFMAIFRTDASKFIFQQFGSPLIQRQIHEHLGATINQITNASLKSFVAALPPTETEQEAIAEALGDADALIESLEQLIAKKRQIKQGTMQALLTGKQRLPGFEKAWDDRVLGDVVDDLEAGVSVNSTKDEPSQEVPCVLKTSAISGGRFISSQCKVIAHRDWQRTRVGVVRNTILISRMNTPDLVGEVAYVDADYPMLFLPDRVWMARFRPELDIDVTWLGYVLSSSDYSRRIKASATGTSGSMKNISKPALLSIEIALPCVEEQTAIATILTDMDTELVELETRLAKTRQLKQGMMQELLTGRIRLV
ncbi:hypothetical protein RHOFW510R12_05735 [Rhodanobacter sp. FW510-R12]|nr:hypothetical protein RHOFW104R8_11010 [Rhodanobacter sp. FW104-R8]KZC28422.1 hypothetical protein RhoFW510T8_11180 [Rhodanobacter sp. FW510-T8]KZC32449.1 hypothetical protein RhoFW510R10_12280 [Rhodanobacter sp. FW510-R10]